MAVLLKHNNSDKYALSRKVATVAMMALLLSGQALLAQTGAVVTSGTANIERAGNVTNINQSTEKASINWQTFSVKANETVNFNQPDVSSVTLNRVIGNERSVIDGVMNANGQVFLLNSNGVLLTRGSSVNTAGFLASTLNITDEDFNAGRYIFKGNGRNSAVINEGSINAQNAGAGGYVALLGNTVSNQGIISATKGTVALASGDKVRLNFNNDSLLGVVIDEGTLNSLVDNRGAIIADSGRVYLTAQAAKELINSQVNTSGLIQARTIGDLKGNIELYAHGGTANIAGTIDASAPNGGGGGFIETSGVHVKIADGTIINTKASNGTNGEWLIDSDGFTIGATTNDGDMSAAALNVALANNNVTIESTKGSGNNGTNDGNINVNGEVNWSQNTLTLNATNNIFINNVVTATNTASLTANHGTGTNADETPMGLYTTWGDNARIDFSGTGALKIGGENYTVINDANALATVRSNPNGNYALGSSVNASSITNWTSLDNGNASGFTGKFNGLGHSFSGIEGVATSMFGTIGNGAMVSNLNVSYGITANSSIAKTSLGIIADVNRGTVVHVNVSGRIDINSANISAVGGLVGVNYGLIAQSRSYASIAGITNTTGGLVGVNESTGRIVDSYAGGVILNSLVAKPTADYVGGLVGVNNGTVQRSFAIGSINLTGSADPALLVGGFVGKNTGTIRESYTSDGTTNTAPRYGGFAGENTGLIENAYTTRLNDYRVENWDAGFVYRNSGTIRNAYATMVSNNINGVRYGFAQTNTGILENVYWYELERAWSFGQPPPPSTDVWQTPGAIQLNKDTVTDFSSYSFGASLPDIWGQSQSGYPILRNTPVLVHTITIPIYGSATSYVSSLGLNVAGLQGNAGIDFSGDSISTCRLTVTCNPFSVVIPNGSSYLDAGVWNASDILTSAYANIIGVVRVNPKPLTIAGVVENRTYDGTTDAVLRNGVAKGGLVGLVGTQTLDINYTSAAFRDRNAENGKVVDLDYAVADGANGGKLSNYILPLTTTANITPKPVDVTITGNDRAYDGTTTATVNGQVSGVISSDDLSFAYTSAFFDSKNAGDRMVTVNGMSLTGADADNYTITGQNSTTISATIAPRPLSLYGFAVEGSPLTVDADNLQAINIVPGDAVSLGGAVTIAASTAGAQSITDFSSLTVDNSNYTVVGSVGSIIIGDANLVLDRVAAGNASITVSGNRTTVTQTTDKAVIDWLRFSLDTDETLVFNQPSSSSIVLNRVITGIPSVIEGALRANGQVFILNSGGVLFTANSSVNVGGLVASTFNMSDDDFLKGNHVFTVARGNGSVIAAGDIVIADNGFIVLAGNHDVVHTSVTSGGDTALVVSTDSLTLTLNLTDNILTDYAIGNLTGETTVGGLMKLGDRGTLVTAGDTVTLPGSFTLNTGSNGKWIWEQNDSLTIGDGTLTRDFLNNNLNVRNFSLTTHQGDMTINANIDWSANTTLSLKAANDIFINRSINAAGANAGLVMNTGGDYHLITPATFSGAVLDATGKPVARQIPEGTEFSSVTLSGGNAKLTINDIAYTLIRDMDGFAALNDATGTAIGYFALAQDIDATAWSPAHTGTPSVVASMSGTLAGLGHTVSNLTLYAPTESYAGLIGQVITTDGMTNILRDIGVVNADIIGAGGVGALAGSASDVVIHQAYSTGKLRTQRAATGGLVGILSGVGIVEYSHSDADVDAVGTGNHLGGLIGEVYSDHIVIRNSHATGAVTNPKPVAYYVNTQTDEQIPMLDEYGSLTEKPVGDWWRVSYILPNGLGGLVGYSFAEIDYSYATGNVDAFAGLNVGGLVGHYTGSSVRNSFATGNVAGGGAVGGLIGEAGLWNGGVTFDNTYATGRVTGTGFGDGFGGGGWLGGLVGSSRGNNNVSNSHATGNVVAISNETTYYVGGLVGLHEGGLISDSYATGTVAGNGGTHTGGLTGQAYLASSLADSYYSDARVARVEELSPVRSESGRIVENVQIREEESMRGRARNGTNSNAVSRSLLDQYIYYGDDADSYSARVKSITVENDDCTESDESCQER